MPLRTSKRVDARGGSGHARRSMSKRHKLWGFGALGALGAFGLTVSMSWRSVLGIGPRPPIVGVPPALPAVSGEPGVEGAGPETQDRLSLPDASVVPRTFAELGSVTARAELEAIRLELALLEQAGDLREASAAEREAAGLVDLFLGDVALRLGDAKRASELADRAQARRPGDGAAQHLVARALAARMQTEGMLFAMGKLGALKEALQRAIELDPLNVDARVEQAALYLMVPKLAGGDVATGRLLAAALEPLAPERAAWLQVTASLVDGDEQRALAAVRAAHERFPADQDLAATLARLEADGDVERAIALYELALEGPRGASWFRAAYALGKLLLEDGRDAARALELFEAYAEECPGGTMLAPVAGAHWRRGQALEALGRPNEARAAYERALELDPELDEARDARAALDAGM